MANPKNIVSLTGVIKGIVVPIIRDNGETFGCRFRLSVRRNYRSVDGTYDEDIIPVKYVFPSESARNFSKRLSEGDTVQLSGTIRWGMYDSRQEQLYVLAESVSLDDTSLKEKYTDPTSGFVKMEF